MWSGFNTEFTDSSKSNSKIQMTLQNTMTNKGYLTEVIFSSSTIQ